MNKLNIQIFLDEIKNNCNEITYLCAHHILFKIYDAEDVNEYNKEILIDHLKNYPELMRYLNDYAGTIYRRYDSSVEEVYTTLADYFGFQLDNEYTIAHVIKKLERQTPALLMSLTDEDIQKQTIENYLEKLSHIKQSNYYSENLNELEEKVNKLEKNIEFVRRTLNI